jgi:hypothetical protein
MDPRLSAECINSQAAVVGKSWDAGVKESSPGLEERILFEGLTHLIDLLRSRKVVECEETKIRNLYAEDAKDLFQFAFVMGCNEERVVVRLVVRWRRSLRR